MAILITGGTGLIGRALITHMPQHEWIVLTRQGEAARHEVFRHLTAVSLRFIRDLSELADNEDISAIVNLVSEPIADKRWSHEQKQRIVDSRIRTTNELITLIERLQQKPDVLVSGSAVGYYGRQGANPVTEQEQNCYDEFSHHLCAMWEAAALKANDYGVRVCLLRTGIVLSADGGALAKMLPPFKFGLGGPMASGNQYMPWIHIDDMVDAIQYLLRESRLHGPFNLCAPNPVTNRAFSRALAKSLHRPCLFPMPEFMLRLLFGEMADLLIYGQRCIPEKLRDAGFIFNYERVNDALNAINGTK
ncbi:TIGR01777 family oxidoreductase [Pseudobowmanella zhangzhouensis]|uniref:TIGR01777 family oxidoreductase n=1 Tax=Pseudobowmanella zhangzhouensis TaxID=1537679 RepID=UPI00360FC1C9